MFASDSSFVFCIMITSILGACWGFLLGRAERRGETLVGAGSGGYKMDIFLRHPWVNLCFYISAVLCALRYGPSGLFLRNFLFISCLFLLTLTDLEDMIIPDECIIFAVVLWFAALPITFVGWKDVGLHILSGLVFGGALLLISEVMDRVMGRETLGGGDIKLFAIVGLYFGFIGALFTLIIACVIGTVFNFTSGKHKVGQPFPFGPCIALAIVVMLLYGDLLINWYWSLA